MRVYFDVCCLNRPFDDLRLDRNRLEAEAVVAIMHHVAMGDWALIGSEAVAMELADCPDEDRRRAIVDMLGVQSESISVRQAEYDRMCELVGLGFGRMDGLHIACSEAATCDVFLTTDDRLLRKALRYRSRLQVRVENPVNWLMEQNP